MNISGKALKLVLKANDLTQESAANFLGITRQTLSVWLKMEILDEKVLQNVKEKLGIDLRNIKEQDIFTAKRIPFYDNEIVFDGGDVLNNSEPRGTIDVGDLLQDSEAAIRIYGNSMLPGYPPGCVVGLIPRSGLFFEPGEIYVVETRDGRMLKRLFYKDDDPSSDYITCYSDNIMKFQGGARDGKLAYPPFDLPKSEITRLFTVTGVIKRNTTSAIVNRYN